MRICRSGRPALEPMALAVPGGRLRRGAGPLKISAGEPY
jgi:hypothetical protein